MEVSNYTWWVFAGLAISALVIDFVVHGKDHEIKIKEASLWSVFYIGLAGVFGAWLYFHESTEAASLFAAGFVLEKMLSVDNLFVFTALFTTFAVDARYRHRILLFGIIGAIVFRGIFVLVGTTAIEDIGPTVEVIFALIILYTAYAMAKSGDEDEDFSDKWFIKYPKKFLPVTEERQEGKFFIGGKATPLFLCLISIELADVAFAFDSVPAVIAITKEPILVYSSMMFAILGLRALYFVLEALNKYLRFLEAAVIAILVFIGGKLMANAFGYHLDAGISLSIVLGLLALAVVASLLIPEKKEEVA